MATDEWDTVFEGKRVFLSLPPRPCRWATEARCLSEVLARPREPVLDRPEAFVDLDSIWQDEEPPVSW
ncbi:hypothetical protein [Stigmatella aurantiaca]|uniref:Uncharacterized protein n=1 Tax=Stigmatella aurantiaca (strain DW4/3-1) TaxID=378806 RepID=E3FEX5_STIAD|nr:hypothetical protein [Stigmatella aurantiaca]ADO70156.1 uncharacterized protein STAUR_2352 [Stigmatella aurantiaca DW4/3-1]